MRIYIVERLDSSRDCSLLTQSSPSRRRLRCKSVRVPFRANVNPNSSRIPQDSSALSRSALALFNRSTFNLIKYLEHKGSRSVRYVTGTLLGSRYNTCASARQTLDSDYAKRSASYRKRQSRGKNIRVRRRRTSEILFSHIFQYARIKASLSIFFFNWSN